MDSIEFLRAHEHSGGGRFVREAQYLKDNWVWLRYSYAVAIKVQRRMDHLGLTQKQLAEKMGCTQQHVSILLKGRSNLTLETLSKLEMALEMDLIGKELCSFSSGYVSSPDTPHLLSDPGEDTLTICTGTRNLVEGYQARKKKGPKKSPEGKEKSDK